MMYRLVSGLLVSLVLAGCNSGGSDDQFAKNRVDSICPVNMECGFMSAPKSYDNETGEQVSIHYGVHKAQDPASRLGILVFNFGGPSAAAVGGVGSMITNNRIPAEILNRFDIVGLDPRGTGQSAFASELIECAVAQDEGRGSCDTVYANFAPYLGSNTVVKDIDRLRAMLGEEKLNFLGYSYGTRLGSLYANMFPERVRAIVLDSPMSPAVANYVNLRVDNTAGYDKVADHRLATPSRRTQYQSVIDQVQSYGSYRAEDNYDLLKSEAIAALDLMVSREPSGDWRFIKDELYTLTDSNLAFDLKQKIQSYTSTQYSNAYSSRNDVLRGNALFTAVVCTDESDPVSLSNAIASRSDFINASSLYGELSYNRYATMCADWPRTRDPIATVVNMDLVLSGQQILIIGGEYDPATPYNWTQKMVESFGSLASVITVNGVVDHGFSYSGYGCVDQSTTAYLLDPTQNIAETTCVVPAVSYGKFSVLAPDAPHPAKDVIGW